MKSVPSPSSKDVISPVIFIYIEGLNLIVVLNVGRDTFVTRIWSLIRDFTTKRSHLLVLIALKDFAKEVILLWLLNSLFLTLISFFYSFTGDLNRHLRSIHLQLKPILCTHCHKKFAKEETLLRHINSTHRDKLLDN